MRLMGSDALEQIDHHDRRPRRTTCVAEHVSYVSAVLSRESAQEDDHAASRLTRTHRV